MYLRVFSFALLLLNRLSGSLSPPSPTETNGSDKSNTGDVSQVGRRPIIWVPDEPFSVFIDTTPGIQIDRPHECSAVARVGLG